MKTQETGLLYNLGFWLVTLSSSTKKGEVE